jgi:hypothetical protein
MNDRLELEGTPGARDEWAPRASPSRVVTRVREVGVHPRGRRGT